MPFISYKPFTYHAGCRHPEHNPPTNMALPEGVHEWQCPLCLHIQTIVSNNPAWKYTGAGMVLDTHVRHYKLNYCAAESDGSCNHAQCPQTSNRLPHCPLDAGEKYVN